MDGFHLTAKQYGGIFALLSVGLIGGSQLNHLLTRKYSNKQIFATVLTAEVIISALLTISVINNWVSLWGYIILLFIMLMCIGLGYPNAVTIALLPFSKNTGSASALSGFLQIGIGGTISSAVGLIPASGSFAMAISMLVSSAIALLIFSFGQKQIVDLKLANT
jgi:DHA1 family bicyclomycin/chloramphenicol resistance-like MFS transporter